MFMDQLDIEMAREEFAEMVQNGETLSEDTLNMLKSWGINPWEVGVKVAGENSSLTDEQYNYMVDNNICTCRFGESNSECFCVSGEPCIDGACECNEGDRVGMAENLV